MSTIKVNKITPRTCNSIQLGESGDTLTIPSGSTLQNCGTATGFGLSFCTTVKTSPFTATANKGFFINTGSAVTVTLPASPSTGDELIVIDSTGQAATNNITLGRNGSKIKGGCNDALMATNRGGLRLVYSGSSQGWITATAGNDEVANTAQFIAATGGTITTSGNFKIHSFTSSGCFQVTSVGNSCGSNTVDYVVVAGGGGGAVGEWGGGGGGAGGYRESSGAASGCYSASPLGACVSALPVSAATYPITIGAGGAGGTNNPYATNGDGDSGSTSVFSSITSAGGGGAGGGNQGHPSPVGTGKAGGSGGGGSGPGGGPVSGSNFGAGNTPPVSPPQGNNGGKSVPEGGGSGGGAGAVGVDGSSSSSSAVGGTGGAGVTSSINASPVTRAGGGGGTGAYPGGSAGTGGSGGGAAGQNAPSGSANAGTANTGGGGGGTNVSPTTAPGVGGAGGSGLVIIRYKFQ